MGSAMKDLDKNIEKVESYYVKNIDSKKAKILVKYNKLHIMNNIDHFGTGSPDYSKLTMKEKTFHGWLKVMLVETESLINGRWDYWLDILETNEVENKPIPKLNFIGAGEPKCNLGRQMIERCLTYQLGQFSGYKNFELFIDWLLYSFGSELVKELPKDINDDLNDYWYKNFKPSILFANPADYFVTVASGLYGKAFNSNAFYPTPNNIVDMMVKMVHSDSESEKEKYGMVCEPCMGSGIMLLHQSNYSLRMFGNDIDMFMCKIATVNMYLYIPWMITNTDTMNVIMQKMYVKYNEHDNVLEWTKDEWDKYKVDHKDNYNFMVNQIRKGEGEYVR